jgi:predicted nucleotidyltransferase component of viral defense system
MLHEDTENFLRVLENTSAQTGFPQLLLEKDYYLTMMLSQINTLGEDLVFKGGTCLNKIYYSYYRLSEDLDFTLKLPSDSPSRKVKQKSIKPVKDGILSYVQTFGMRIEELDNVGHNESSQYIWIIDYNSIVLEKPQSRYNRKLWMEM